MARLCCSRRRRSEVSKVSGFRGAAMKCVYVDWMCGLCPVAPAFLSDGGLRAYCNRLAFISVCLDIAGFILGCIALDNVLSCMVFKDDAENVSCHTSKSKLHFRHEYCWSPGVDRFLWEELCFCGLVLKSLHVLLHAGSSQVHSRMEWGHGMRTPLHQGDPEALSVNVRPSNSRTHSSRIETQSQLKFKPHGKKKGLVRLVYGQAACKGVQAGMTIGPINNRSESTLEECEASGEAYTITFHTYERSRLRGMCRCRRHAKTMEIEFQPGPSGLVVGEFWEVEEVDTPASLAGVQPGMIPILLEEEGKAPKSFDLNSYQRCSEGVLPYRLTLFRPKPSFPKRTVQKGMDKVTNFVVDVVRSVFLEGSSDGSRLYHEPPRVLWSLAQCCILLALLEFLRQSITTLSFMNVEVSCNNFTEAEPTGGKTTMPQPELQQNHGHTSLVVVTILCFLSSFFISTEVKAGIQEVTVKRDDAQEIEDLYIDKEFPHLPHSCPYFQDVSGKWYFGMRLKEKDAIFSFFKPAMFKRLDMSCEGKIRKRTLFLTIATFIAALTASQENWLCTKTLRIEASWSVADLNSQIDLISACGRPFGTGPASMFASWFCLLAALLQFVLLTCPPALDDDPYNSCIAMILHILPPATQELIRLVSGRHFIRDGWPVDVAVDCHVWVHSTPREDMPDIERDNFRQNWVRSDTCRKVNLIYKDEQTHRKWRQGLERGHRVPSVCIEFLEGELVRQIIPVEFFPGLLHVQIRLGPKIAYESMFAGCTTAALLLLLYDLATFSMSQQVLHECGEIHPLRGCTRIFNLNAHGGCGFEFRISMGFWFSVVGVLLALLSLCFHSYAHNPSPAPTRAAARA